MGDKLLTANDIIEGAYFAIDQAGRLINDAAALYKLERWATTLALSVFCLEEIGKAEMLLRKAADAKNTGPKSVEDVKKGGFNEHTSKLKKARQITITASLGWWGEPPDDATQVAKQLDNALGEYAKRAPSEAHKARLSALFVDLFEDGWHRPAEVTEGEASDMLVKANIEYRERWERFVNATDPLLKEAERALGRRLPDPLPEPAQIRH